VRTVSPRSIAPQVLAEEREVDGLEGLEVVLALRVAGRERAVDVVVVEGDAHGVDAQHLELHREPLEKRGLARRGRARDAEHPRTIEPRREGVGELPDALLVKALGHAHDRRHPPGHTGRVEVPCAGDAQGGQPALVLAGHRVVRGAAVALVQPHRGLARPVVPVTAR
jgi:hypothetical protein